MIKANSLSFLLSVFLSFLFLSCQDVQKNSDLQKCIRKTDTCAVDPTHTYEIYIPERSQECEHLPLIIILDPQGNGKKAIDIFRFSADQYSGIIVASNRIKNNLPDYANALKLLIADVQSKYPYTDKIYLAGFSGGARMVLNYSLSKDCGISGILVSGVLASEDQLLQISCPVVSLSGMADFNFIETAPYISNPDKSPENLLIILTSSSHEWPDRMNINDALGYILFNSGYKEKCTAKHLLNKFCKRSKYLVDSLKAANDYLRAGQIARAQSKITVFNDKTDFVSIRNSIEQSNLFNNELKQLTESIRLELSLRDGYYKAIQEKNPEWWQYEINLLNNKIVTETDKFRKFALMRIKGFLGIMCFSMTNKSILDNNLVETERLLQIYRLIEPENPDMYYFSAIVSKKKKDTVQAEKYLLKALNGGFSDYIRLENDFTPEEIEKIKSRKL
jgi:hypothetical protein